jgi:hypothetical protein
MKYLLVLLILTSCSTNQNIKNETESNQFKNIPTDILEKYKEQDSIEIKPILEEKKTKFKKHIKKEKIKNNPIAVLPVVDEYISIPTVSLPFKKGEALKYKVKLKGINIGEMTFSVSNSTKFIKNREVLELTSELRSTGIVGSLYKIKTNVSSIVDKSKFFSYKYTVQGVEGSLYKKSYELYDSDSAQSFVYYYDKKDNNVTETTNKYDIIKYPQDLLSIFYYVRTFDLTAKKQYPLNITTKDKNKKGKFIVETENDQEWNIHIFLDEKDKNSNTNNILLTLNKNNKIISKIELETKIGTLSMTLSE